MPNLLFIYGFRFFFYSNEGVEPMHVHVVKGSANGKIWLEPSIEVAYFFDFTKAEQKQIIELVNLHVVAFKLKWNEYFNK